MRLEEEEFESEDREKQFDDFIIECQKHAGTKDILYCDRKELDKLWVKHWDNISKVGI